MCKCISNQNITYQCADEAGCRKVRNAKAVEIEKKEALEREKHKHLTQEGQFKARYNIDFEELEELDCRFRDGSTHYYHRKTDQYYSWSFTGGYWYQTKFDLRKYVQ